MARKRYKKIPFDKITEVYAKKAGNISATCVSLGIDRSTFQKWRKEYQELEERLTEVDESLVDFSESKLLEQIQDGNLTAIIFHLKTKGKKRGYVEQSEQKVELNAFEALMQRASQVEDEEY